jgi:hypothetical protein
MSVQYHMGIGGGAEMDRSGYYFETDISFPALVRGENITGTWLERAVSKNVETLRFLYGVDTNGDGAPDQYLTAAQIGVPNPAVAPASPANDWRNVVSVHVALLMVSDRNLLPAPQTYTFNGETVTATDNRLRFPYETTVYLRNRFNY